MAESGTLKRSRDFDDDPFENFKFEPPRSTGPFRAFTRRSKYRSMATYGSRDLSATFGSNSSLSVMSGSSQNLLDSNKLMSLQDDAQSRRISAEVMKHRLYESVIVSPRHRRLSMHSDSMDNFLATSRMTVSMPVTPAHSHNVTPQHSPTSSRRRFHWFSRGGTPGTPPAEDDLMEVEEDSWKGLASLFRPQPRYVPVGRWSHNVENDEQQQQMDMDGRRTSPQHDDGLFLRDVPKRAKRCSDVDASSS